jgi:cell division protein ZapA (FtsZ GTPase activity inhibitor)
MSSDFRTTSVMILGREYKIRTNEDEEFVLAVAEFVDDMMNRISAKMMSGTTSQVAVLTALNIAEELFRERRMPHVAPPGAMDEVNERLRSLSLRLDEVLDSASNSRKRAVSRPAVPA